jgi:hypothetical protein
MRLVAVPRGPAAVRPRWRGRQPAGCGVASAQLPTRAALGVRVPVVRRRPTSLDVETSDSGPGTESPRGPERRRTIRGLK